MKIQIEVEFDDTVYAVDATVTPGEAATYDYQGSSPEIEIWAVYNENGCEIMYFIDSDVFYTIEDEVYQAYERLSE
tara:strand:- start:254 stop:481 length:228 start_codon:yes stop_codon:yes gene_type:complete